MRGALAIVGAICIACAGCTVPQQRSAVNDTAVMGAGEESTPQGRAIAESLGFHGPRRGPPSR